MKLRCVECHEPIRQQMHDGLSCAECGKVFQIFKGKPVLISEKNPLFKFSNYDEHSISTHGKKIKIPRVLRISASVNTERSEKLRFLADNLQMGSTILVLGAGNQLEDLRRIFSGSKVIACDVDTSADVDFFADAHDIPLVSESVDLVISTAVFEHVLEPWNVVEEVYRILKPNGYVYSEVPFMQNVHEGAYDFTRFTLLGHELLFKHFCIMQSGSVAGPFTTLSWQIEYLLSFFTSWLPLFEKAMKAMIRITLWPLRSLDFLLRGFDAAFDSASCTYVLAKKVYGHEIDWDLEKRYRGGKRYVRQQ